MPQLTGREYLNQFISLDKLLKSLEADLMRTRADIMSLQAIDYSKDIVTGGKSVDLADKIAKLDEQTQVINQKWDELINLRNEARELIYQVKPFECCSMLVERYLVGRSVDEIAEMVKCSSRQAHRIHDRAISAFENVYAKHVINWHKMA